MATLLYRLEYENAKKPPRTLTVEGKTLQHMVEELHPSLGAHPSTTSFDIYLPDGGGVIGSSEPLPHSFSVDTSVIYRVAWNVTLTFHFSAETPSTPRRIKVPKRSIDGPTVRDVKEMLHKQYKAHPDHAYFQVFDGKTLLMAHVPVETDKLYRIVRRQTLTRNDICDLPQLDWNSFVVNGAKKAKGPALGPAPPKIIPTTGMVEEELYPLPLTYTGKLQVYANKENKLYLRIKDVLQDPEFVDLRPKIKEFVKQIKNKRRREQRNSITRAADVRRT